MNIPAPHFVRDFLCFGGEDRDEEVPCGLLSALPTYAEAHTLAWETALSCPISSKDTYPHFMRDFLRFGGEDRDERVPCGSRVGFGDIRRGAPALRETALSCPILLKKLCYISPPRILCGIFCVLAERTERKRFLVVRVPEGCLQPEEIRRGAGANKKRGLGR